MDHELTVLMAFHQFYEGLERSVQDNISRSSDANVLARLKDDISEFANLIDEHAYVFQTTELQILRTNIGLMQQDVQVRYREVLDQSHGCPTTTEIIRDGTRGRPRITIDREFLIWAHAHRSTSELARFLGVSRGTVRRALLDEGIAMPGVDPGLNRSIAAPNSLESGLVDVINPIPHETPNARHFVQHDQPRNLSDEELDDLIKQLRPHFRKAGIAMLDGMLRRLDWRVPRERIRASLMRVDPVRRIFDRIRISRRVYCVPGPNSLWHNDGQHGLIRWGIVIHGFIDGYSRLITGLQASNNNKGETVLNLFLSAAEIYGVPSRIRGDHGTENILLAAWMQDFYGTDQQGSYIWGRSVHNVRIERLWVDVTTQVGSTWADLFTKLEISHGLDINNEYHLWLLHCLFLPTINDVLTFFAQSWNEHRIQIRGGPNRSPSDMFGFDMLVYGVRGEELADGDLESYGVDWEGLNDKQLLQSRSANNPDNEESSSWVSEGLPERLNTVHVEAPVGPPSINVIILEAVSFTDGLSDDASVFQCWNRALVVAHMECPHLF